MRYIKLILLLSIFAIAKENIDNRLYLFVNSSIDKVELKWFTKKYSSKYSYKIYRSTKGEKRKFLNMVKPVDYKLLKKEGYDDDYIFMIYPKKGIKNIKDSIEIAKIINNVDGFRLIKFMYDISFARNMGGYYADYSVKKNKVYLYIVVAYEGKKEIDRKAIYAHTFKQGVKSDFLWVQAEKTDKGIGLRWDVQKYINYYNIYRKKSNQKSFEKINENLLYITKEYAKRAKYLYVDKNLQTGESATYYIKRVNMFAKEGSPSKKVTIKYENDLKKPSIPRDIFIVNSDKKIKIAWAKRDDVKGYNIYRSTVYRGNYKKLNKKLIKEGFYFDKNFQVGKNYYYYVTAINGFGESAPSTKVLAYARDTTKPNKPKNLKASVKPGIVFLNWDAVKDKDLLGYRVYVSMDQDNKHWELINNEPVKENSFKHERYKTLSRFPYYYRVSAVDKSYNESYPSNIVKIKLPDVIPPKEPFIKSFRAYTTKIVLEWNQIFVYDFDHYNVYKKEGGKFVKLNKKPLLRSKFIDFKPQRGVNQYVVTAVDKSGNESKKTNVKKIVLKDNIPVKIDDFKVVKTKAGVKASFTCKDKDYAGFKLFRRGEFEPKYSNISNFIKDKKSYLDKQISKKGLYYYMVKAYDKSGNISESRVLSVRAK